jgi:hypothetical protein
MLYRSVIARNEGFSTINGNYSCSCCEEDSGVEAGQGCLWVLCPICNDKGIHCESQRNGNVAVCDKELSDWLYENDIQLADFDPREHRELFEIEVQK